MDLINKSRYDAYQRQLNVAQIIDAMITNGEIINFQTVAERCGVSRSYLYRHPEFREIIETCRISGMTKSELQQEVIRLRLRVRELEKNLEKHDLPSCTSVDNLSSLTSMPGENTYIGDIDYANHQ